MTQIYKFRVAVEGAKRYIWREFEMLSTSTVAELAYVIMATLECDGGHLYCLKCNGDEFECYFEGDYFDVKPKNPNIVKLNELDLVKGDTLSMDYDFGCGWTFDINVKEVKELPIEVKLTSFPRITAGKGYGILEDVAPWAMFEAIKRAEESGVLPNYDQIASGMDYEEYEAEAMDEDDPDFWDYKEFDVKEENKALPQLMREYKKGYGRLTWKE